MVILFPNEKGSLECYSRKTTQVRRLDFRHDVVSISTLRFPPSQKIGTGNEFVGDVLAIYFDPDRTPPVQVVRDEICPRGCGAPFFVLGRFELGKVEKTDASQSANVRVVFLTSTRAIALGIGDVWFR